MHADDFKIAGTAKVEGRSRLAVPLDRFPLLAWQPGHPEFGDCVFLEDQSASVDEVESRAVEDGPGVNDLADLFATTSDHIRQALAYADAGGIDQWRRGPH